MRTREEAGKHYSLLKILRFAYEDIGILGFRYYIYFVVDIVIRILVPFLLVLAPAAIVQLLEANAELSELIRYILLWLGLILIANLIRTFAGKQVQNMADASSAFRYWNRINQKALSSELKDLENKEIQKRMHEARYSLSDGDGFHFAGPKGLFYYSSMFVVSVCGLVLYTVMAVRVHLILLGILLLTSVLTCFFNSKATTYEFKNIGKFWDNNRVFWYLKGESINHEKSKDVRVYRMHDWFKRQLNQNTEQATEIYGDVKQKKMFADMGGVFLSFGRDIFAYLYLIFQMRNGTMTVAEFVLYIGVIIGFGNWVMQIVESFMLLRKIGNELAVFYDFVEDSDDFFGEQGDNGYAVPKSCREIIFEDICFSYEGKKVFEHFNLTIREGEKLALVGINGAGKTTLMKLLCGLYPLEEGRILVDGTDIHTMEKEQYYPYISILFQDVRILPFSIAKNVACGWNESEIQEFEKLHSHSLVGAGFKRVDQTMHINHTYEEEKVREALKRANLWEKIKSLPKGLDTSLTKVLDAEGILLSGGETQRLMLARALYKDAPILILDEPTAALDPIAESELYEEYSELCAKKISVFISHRLSSTRFCDRILFLENGNIEEEGTHEELMSRQGKYAKMYQIQAHYYQQEVQKHEAGI